MYALAVCHQDRHRNLKFKSRTVKPYFTLSRCFCSVQRATKIEIQYQDLDGKLQQMALRDFPARIFQHEYDHLQVGQSQPRAAAATSPGLAWVFQCAASVHLRCHRALLSATAASKTTKCCSLCGTRCGRAFLPGRVVFYMMPSRCTCIKSVCCCHLKFTAATAVIYFFFFLQGVLFHDRMKSAEVEKVRQQLVDLEETFIAANPDVAVQRVPAASSKVAAKAKGFGSITRR